MRRRSSPGRSLPALALVPLSLLASPAARAETPAQPYPACNKTVTSNESEAAHARYIAGKADYDEAAYEQAIRRFRDAYVLDCTKHELLVIISAAYERKGDKREAIAALETYLARAPSAPDAATYQAKIENLRKQLASTPSPPQPNPEPTPTPPAPAREHTIPPWVVFGVGAGALVAGGVIVLTTPSLPVGCVESSKTCIPIPGETDAKFTERQDQAGRSVDQPRVGYIFLAAGGVLAAGGLLWHFLEPTGPRESTRTRIRPSFAPSYAGLSVGGAF